MRMNVPGGADILEYAHRLGWRRACFRGAYVAANQVMHLSVFDCFELGRADVPAALTRTDGNYEGRFLAPGEQMRFARQLDAEFATVVRDAMARGDAAYVILDDERLANIGLYAALPTPVLDDLIVHFDAPSRYMYRGYTQREYRGRRLHALGILRAAQELFDRQVPALVTVCERTNYPATISVLRMGWRRRGTVFRIAIGPSTLVGRTPSARALGMRLAVKE